MIDPLQANWQALSDTDVIGLLRNSEGCNSTDRALFLEAARRIEAQSKRYEALINLISNDQRINADLAESNREQAETIATLRAEIAQLRASFVTYHPPEDQEPE